MLLYVKKTIRKGIKIIQTFDQDLIEVVMKKSFFNLKDDRHLLFTYASPINSCYTKFRSGNILEKIETKEADYQSILVMGDLNGRTKTGDDFVRDRSDKYSPINTPIYKKDTELNRNNMDEHPIDKQGKLILDLCKTTGLKILNGRIIGDSKGQFTRFPLHKNTDKPSTIDYVLCGPSLMNEVFSFSILPFSELSDHCCLSLTIKVNREQAVCDESDSEVTVTPGRESYIFDQNRIDIFKENIRTDRNLDTLNTLVNTIDPCREEVFQSVTCLSDVLLGAAKKSFLPKKNVKQNRKTRNKKSKIWFNNECTIYRKILRKYSRQLSSQPFNKNALHLFQKHRMKYKNVCRKAEKQYRFGLMEQLKTIEANDPSQFWYIINKMNNWGKETTDHTDNITPAKWHNYYKSLLNSTKKNEHENNHDLYSEIPSFDPILDSRITKKEMNKALHDLKRRKSPGPDGILTEYLKVFGELYEDNLLKIIRIIFSGHLYPPEWDINYLKPIYKKDDTENPDNYRGIALGSSFAKLFSTILLNRLLNYIETKNLISPNQVGFVKGSRTSDHIFLLQTLIGKIVKKNGGKLYTAFIDFKKAYDTVDRGILFNRLKELGIHGTFYHNIVTMYENTKYSIKVKNGCLDPISSNLGLRQGCPLSPMLFNLYIDDIKNIFGENTDPITLQDKKINHFLYADDLVLVSESAKGLQNCLDSLSAYAERKILTINITKSKTMIFNPAGQYIKRQFYISEKELQPVRTFCYLGFEVKPSGTVKHAMNTMNDKAHKALRPLLCAIANFHLPLKTATRLFHTLITPIALYNVENWATMTDKELEKFSTDDLFEYIEKSRIDILHRKLLKYVLGIPKSCPNMTIYGDTGEIPISIKGYKLMLDYWNRLNALPETNLAKTALRENIDIRTNWIMTIEKLLVTFNRIEANDNKKFKTIAKYRTETYYKTQWESKIKNNDSSRLKFYKNLKNDFTPADYIDLPFHLRKIVAKLRCSGHCLEIEKGRHKNIETKDRICNMCTDKAVEDEDHFLSKCKAYEQLRKKYHITDYNTTDIMNTSNQRNLAFYLMSAFELRTNSLNQNA